MVFDPSTLAEINDSWEASLALARLSELAYETDMDRLEHQLKKDWGFSGFRPFDEKSTEGFVVWNRQALIVAYRGTNNLLDWLANLELARQERPWGEIHSGFYWAFDAVRAPVTQALENSHAGDKCLWLTGHSLGGALATITLGELHGRMAKVALRTFGEPRSLDQAAASYLHKRVAASMIRYVNDGDPIPRLPPGYEHAGREVRFDSRGDPQEMMLQALPRQTSAMTLEEFHQLQERLRARLDRRSYPEARPEGMLFGFSDHAIASYVRLMERQCGRT